ncbi:UNVERIFIED_CONTAM: hypothetical protein HDU68_001558 [Siphonaria sp. JEL0065]|nr:hypothetical protein HDU68_001558 [Siphonaria sp. JEL0065]
MANNSNRKSVNRHSKFDFSQSAPTHFTSETEIAAYVNWINTQLANDPDLSTQLPISSTKENSLFEALSDGVILCKLVNNSVPGTIPEKQVTKNAKTVIHKFENLQKALAGAIKIGVHVHNLSAEDIMKGTPHLVLGLVWQVIKVGLLQNVSTSGTESANTSSNDIASKAIEPSTLSLEKALLKWVNGTLKKQNLQLRVSNFGGDLSDSVALAYLISSFDDTTSEAEKILQEQDITKRAELVLDYAQKFDCRHFASATDIVHGNKNLNLAFVAVLHNLKVSRDKTQQIRIQLEGAKESAEQALLRVNSSKDVETKKLRLQLDDAREEAEHLRQERDALQNDLDELRTQAEEQEEVYEENNQLLDKVAVLEKELEQSRQVNDKVSTSFESLSTSFSKVFQTKKDLVNQSQLQSNRIVELQAELDFARQQVKELQESSKDLRKQLAEFKQTSLSFQSLNDLSAPANSLNNLSNNQQQEDLAQQLAESQTNSQKLQYKLLALQSESSEKAQELELALQRAERAEEQAQQSTESLAQLYERTKQQHQSKSTISNQASPNLQKKQQELVESIDTLNEEVLALQLMKRDDPEREKLLQEQIRQMQQLTIQLVAHAHLNEAEVVERVFYDLRKHQGNLFDQLQLKDRSQRDLVSALAEFVSQLNRKATDNEKKVEQLSKSIDTLNDELQKKSQKQEKSFRDADIDSVAGISDSNARKETYVRLRDEKAKLQDRLSILHRTTAAIMEQRSLLITENKKLLNNESAEAINLSRQIASLDNLLGENLKFRKEIEEGNEDFFSSSANLEELAVQQIKVQQQVDAMVRSEDCLIEDLNTMKESNQELLDKLEDAQRCISALMAQRSILLKDRDELKEQLAVSKSQQSLLQSNNGLNRTKHNNSFASAPNLASQQ